MRKRMYKCMMSALAAALFFLPYTGTMSVSAQEAAQSIAAADEATEPVVTRIHTDSNGVTNLEEADKRYLRENPFLLQLDIIWLPVYNGHI